MTDGIGHALDRPATVEQMEAVIQEALADEAAERSRRVSLGSCVDTFDLRDRLDLEVADA